MRAETRARTPSPPVFRSRIDALKATPPRLHESLVNHFINPVLVYNRSYPTVRPSSKQLFKFAEKERKAKIRTCQYCLVLDVSSVVIAFALFLGADYMANFSPG